MKIYNSIKQCFIIRKIKLLVVGLFSITFKMLLDLFWKRITTEYSKDNVLQKISKNIPEEKLRRECVTKPFCCFVICSFDDDVTVKIAQ